MSFTVKNGTFQPDDAQCRHCGETDCISCKPGQWPQCWRCGSKLIYLGKVPDVECCTPSGRIDCHMKYVSVKDGVMSCAFCGKVAT